MKGIDHGYYNEGYVDFQSDTNTNSKGQNGTLDVTLDELAALTIIKENPKVTQKQLAESIGVSDRTIKRRITVLKEKGILIRENVKRNGVWIINASGNPVNVIILKIVIF